jgi:acetylornithine deacetylase/succinyl-diaminopimelate desuccinylase-like protein
VLHGLGNHGAHRGFYFHRVFFRNHAAVAIMNGLFAENVKYQQVLSKVPGIKHPYVNIGRIEGGTNTNVIPGKVMLKLDRRMIPEENPVEVEASMRAVIAKAVEHFNTEGGYQGKDAVRVDIKRLLLAHAMTPLADNQPLVDAIQTHGEAVFGEKPPAVGTPLYTDVRLYAERGIPGVIYGAGPRTVLESHAKRSDERLVLEDLRRATKVVARSLVDLLA